MLIVEDAGSVYAMSNKCSHLGLPLQGKTAMFTAEVRLRCVRCARCAVCSRYAR